MAPSPACASSGSSHPRLDAGRAAVLGEDAGDGGAREDLGAAGLRVDQPGLGGRQLRSRRVAEPHVRRGLCRVAVAIGVAGDPPEVVAQPLAALPQALVRAIQVRAILVHPEALEHGIEVLVVARLGEVREPVLRRPLGAHVVRRPQAVGPVDDRPAAHALAGDDRHLPLRRRERPAVQVHAAGRRRARARRNPRRRGSHRPRARRLTSPRRPAPPPSRRRRHPTRRRRRRPRRSRPSRSPAEPEAEAGDPRAPARAAPGTPWSPSSGSGRWPDPARRRTGCCPAPAGS